MLAVKMAFLTKPRAYKILTLTVLEPYELALRNDSKLFGDWLWYGFLTSYIK